MNIFIKFFYIIINPARRLYWRVFKPKTFGVKCLIERDGKILMIRNSYGAGYWTLPGGRLKRNELPENGAAREVREEVGIIINSPKFLGSYFSISEHKRDTVYCFTWTAPTDFFKINPQEIAEAKWIDKNAIPDFHGRAVDEFRKMPGGIN
jgi:ADP-ribose pyrophosphatase YjhB (NUDIX family)